MRATALAAPPSVSGLRLEAVEAFVVLAEEDLSFKRVARRLFLSQSGMSRRISGLERCLGTRLILSTTREVELTEAGRQLLPCARELLHAARRTSEVVSELARA